MASSQSGEGSHPEKSHRHRFGKLSARHQRLLSMLAGVAITLFLLGAYNVYTSPRSSPAVISQRDLHAAIKDTLDHATLSSPEAKAFQTVRRSIVEIRQIGSSSTRHPGTLTGIGTGVVIVDSGIILTNLHVVTGAEQLQVIFADGLVSDAAVISVQPQNDLAVLQAHTLPDDLVAATMRSTKDLAMGDKVIAVGFPFGIGPSVSSGVISGLRREYQSPEAQHTLTELIQFDAAVNPGNSGGPLVTMDGAVVGIVTAIFNPGMEDVFIGLGFAVPIDNAASAAGDSPF